MVRHGTRRTATAVVNGPPERSHDPVLPDRRT